ncbi:hypothetical protein Q9233_011929 [Columba guinea]|nr:hypothetical protein Q9233_011929 [Columba guinea]
MFHWGKWKKRMGASASSSKRPVFDEREDAAAYASLGRLEMLPSDAFSTVFGENPGVVRGHRQSQGHRPLAAGVTCVLPVPCAFTERTMTPGLVSMELVPPGACAAGLVSMGLAGPGALCCWAGVRGAGGCHTVWVSGADVFPVGVASAAPEPRDRRAPEIVPWSHVHSANPPATALGKEIQSLLSRRHRCVDRAVAGKAISLGMCTLTPSMRVLHAAHRAMFHSVTSVSYSGWIREDPLADGIGLWCDRQIGVLVPPRIGTLQMGMGGEWNGMEWNGMEWNGMEWNGME